MPELTDISGVSESRAEDLREEGFTTVDDVANATESDLTEVSGVGGATAPGLIESARDVLRSTIEDPDEEDEDDDAEEEEANTVDDREVPEEIPDLEESDDDVEAEDESVEEVETTDEADSEGVDEDTTDEETSDGYTVEIALETPRQYDNFIYALIDMRSGRRSPTYEEETIATDLLDAVRPLDGTGTIKVNLTESNLNSLHALLTQTENAYRGQNNTAAFEAVRAVKEQIQEARTEYIL